MEPGASDRMEARAREAAAVLRAGGLVAFPTETVYGLGCDAHNPAAVARVFAVKGRPAGHPLIVHLGGAEELGGFAREVPAGARRLAAAFWPGPLTLILLRADGVPDAVTGGLETVGLRVPAHPAARALLAAFGGGIAAPSANRFGRVSPTTAAHVREDLGAEVDYVLDGGPCAVGLESTIVDLSGAEPALLRPGAVTPEAVAAVLGRPVRGPEASATRAPGRLPVHYAPRARVILASAEEARAVASELLARGLKTGVLGPDGLAPAGAVALAWPADLEAAARVLYERLREVDRLGLDAVVVVPPPDEGLGHAVRDRLARAAAGR